MPWQILRPLTPVLGVLERINFTRQDGAKSPTIKHVQIITHFDLYRRREFPDSVGKKGAEFNIMAPTKLWSQCHLK